MAGMLVPPSPCLGAEERLIRTSFGDKNKRELEQPHREDRSES